MIRSALLRGAAIIVIVIAGAYIVDGAIFEHRVAMGGSSAFGSVRVYLATPEKGNRLEIFTGQPHIVPCAHALFPRGGASPCWYLKRHTTQVE
ncbi:MAG TPA: hypothetical protein VMU43_09500 [Candidatus Acidoferrum sp.]|nr:hypothetical protein [Candidatus Acidoferrum sp.]